MCDCNYVYVVMEASNPTPIGMRVFSSFPKAFEYMKVLQGKYPNYSNYYVESLEVD